MYYYYVHIHLELYNINWLIYKNQNEEDLKACKERIEERRNKFKKGGRSKKRTKSKSPPPNERENKITRK